MNTSGQGPNHNVPLPKSILIIVGLLVAAALIIGIVARATSKNASTSDGRIIKVVAAENFWGSIASQLGGDHAKVTSIITNPDTDPHDYEPTAADGRTVADAQYAIINGIGYDAWADKLLSANNSTSTTLNIGDLVGIAPGGNPHRWYSPDNVNQVIDRITTDYKKLDPTDAAYFDQQKANYENNGLKQYNALVTDIKTNYAGIPVGASESIFSPLAQSLGLNLITPNSFLNAMSEGSDPTAADKTTIDRQITSHQIKVYVYNSQNSTPDVARQIGEAKAASIPVVTVTETLTPAGATFQDWQARQLQDLKNALAQATGK